MARFAHDSQFGGVAFGPRFTASTKTDTTLEFSIQGLVGADGYYGIFGEGSAMLSVYRTVGPFVVGGGGAGIGGSYAYLAAGLGFYFPKP